MFFFSFLYPLRPVFSFWLRRLWFLCVWFVLLSNLGFSVVAVLCQWVVVCYCSVCVFFFLVGGYMFMFRYFLFTALCLVGLPLVVLHFLGCIV